MVWTPRTRNHQRKEANHVKAGPSDVLFVVDLSAVVHGLLQNKGCRLLVRDCSEMLDFWGSFPGSLKLV